MLVLSRKPHEAIWINDDIKVVVVEIRDGKVRLGIQAPQHVAVYREEIKELIDAQKTKVQP